MWDKVMVIGDSDFVDGRVEVSEKKGLPVEDAFTKDIFGHKIVICSSEIMCLHCGESEVFPSGVGENGGYYEVLCKMYILGGFKNTDCSKILIPNVSAQGI